jgi:hypothetical protein
MQRRFSSCSWCFPLPAPAEEAEETAWPARVQEVQHLRALFTAAPFDRAFLRTIAHAAIDRTHTLRLAWPRSSEFFARFFLCKCRQ